MPKLHHAFKLEHNKKIAYAAISCVHYEKIAEQFNLSISSIQRITDTVVKHIDAPLRNKLLRDRHPLCNVCIGDYIRYKERLLPKIKAFKG